MVSVATVPCFAPHGRVLSEGKSTKQDKIPPHLLNKVLWLVKSSEPCSHGAVPSMLRCTQMVGLAEATRTWSLTDPANGRCCAARWQQQRGQEWTGRKKQWILRKTTERKWHLFSPGYFEKAEPTFFCYRSHMRKIRIVYFPAFNHLTGKWGLVLIMQITGNKHLHGHTGNLCSHIQYSLPLTPKLVI